MEKIKKLTEKEYKTGIKSGELLHVFDKRNKKLILIKRDGYYPPERLKDFVNIEKG